MSLNSWSRLERSAMRAVHPDLGLNRGPPPQGEILYLQELPKKSDLDFLGQSILAYADFDQL